MNVADNCVDRWAEDPDTAQTTAVIWEGEPGDVRTRQLRRAGRRGQPARGRAWLDLGRDRRATSWPSTCPTRSRRSPRSTPATGSARIYTILFSGFGPDAVRVPAGGLAGQGWSSCSTPPTGAASSSRCWRRCGRPAARCRTVRARRSWSTAPGAASPLQDGEISYTDALELAPDGTPAVPLEANDPAFLIFTSGTEARPRAWCTASPASCSAPGPTSCGRSARGRRRVLGRRRRRLADVPDPGRVGGLANGMTMACFEGAWTSHQRGFYEICERHRRDQGAGGADAAAHAA